MGGLGWGAEEQWSMGGLGRGAMVHVVTGLGAGRGAMDHVRTGLGEGELWSMCGLGWGHGSSGPWEAWIEG